MKRVLYRDDGGVSVIIPAPKSRRKDETEEQWLERVFLKATPEGATFLDVEDDQIPIDREYRNSWSCDGSTIKHDMVKARAIHKGKMRPARKPKLVALDVEYIMADESDDTIKKGIIADKKKALRDVTDMPEIELAQSIEDLRLAWPEILD